MLPDDPMLEDPMLPDDPTSLPDDTKKSWGFYAVVVLFFGFGILAGWLLLKLF
ncbi:MAG: hypothetical protein OXI24_00395 [Candidatus Poribacteria bacterium]|nr:hypothetical protein [Candidatus Poribacteria bacterium]MDE0427384.1 hypothetical protein [Candidatus Poribacteria bacterium]MDE0552646.1 hypothetical protein [Candidatus Poribacteria bacterium]